MTDFDKKLIEKDERFSRHDYRDIDVLIAIAESDLARERLKIIRWELYDLLKETI